MNNTLDRVEPEFFEADDEGYMQGSAEAGPDGKAKGIEFCLYIQYPEEQLKHYPFEGKFAESLTDEEKQEFVPWVQKEYPGCDWSFDADFHATASFYDNFREGEDNEALMMRLTVNNPDYNRLRNEGTIFYHLLEKFIEHIKAKRED